MHFLIHVSHVLAFSFALGHFIILIGVCGNGGKWALVVFGCQNNKFGCHLLSILCFLQRPLQMRDSPRLLFVCLLSFFSMTIGSQFRFSCFRFFDRFTNGSVWMDIDLLTSSHACIGSSGNFNRLTRLNRLVQTFLSSSSFRFYII